MSTTYQPGIWAQKYKTLPKRERDQVNQQTNQIFAHRTGVTRKLDPRRDQALCATWLTIRDEVMSGQHRSPRNAVQRVSQFVSSIGEFANSAADAIYDSLRSNETPWMDIARAELRKGVKEKKGKEHNPEVMKYIRSCPDLYATKNKRIYTEREGEEGVKWCSAFVNWCMKRAGIMGTNSARALSWTQWGKPCPEPVPGAVLVTKGSKYRHVAFVEEVNGELKMLGGNQTQANGKGDYNQVSIRPISYSTVVAYRLPH